MANIVRAGVILIIYEFIIVFTYIIISTPVATTIASLATAGTGMGVSQMAFYKGLVDAVFSICMGLMALIPVIWFMFRVYQREPDWGYR